VQVVDVALAGWSFMGREPLRNEELVLILTAIKGRNAMPFFR
jgi:hypothetical protein